MKRKILQMWKRTAGIGLTAVMLLSGSGTYLLSGAGMTQTAALEESASSEAEEEHVSASADGVVEAEPTDLISTFITDAALLEDVEDILGKGAAATYQDMLNYTGEVNLDNYDNVTEIQSIAGLGAFENAEKFVFRKATQVTEIPNYEFAATKVKSLELPATIKTIGMYAFQECTLLTSFAVPASVESIGMLAFDKAGIKTIDFSQCESLKSIGKRCFERCASLTTINIPADTPLETIGSQAFRQCTALQTVFLPDSVVLVEASAFAHCKKLATISIPASCVLDWTVFCDSTVSDISTIVTNLDLQLRAGSNENLIIPLGKEISIPLYAGKSLDADEHSWSKDPSDYSITEVTIGDTSAITQTENTDIVYTSGDTSVNTLGVNLLGEKVAQDISVTVKTSMTFATYSGNGTVRTITVTPSVTYKASVQTYPCTEIQVEEEYHTWAGIGRTNDRYLTIAPVFKSGESTIITDEVQWSYGDTKSAITVAEDKLSATITFPYSQESEKFSITITAGNQSKTVTIYLANPPKKAYYDSNTINLNLNSETTRSQTVTPYKIDYCYADRSCEDTLTYVSQDETIVKAIPNGDNSVTLTAVGVGTTKVAIRPYSYSSLSVGTLTVTVTDTGTYTELQDSSGNSIGNTISFDATKGKSSQTFGYVFKGSGGQTVALTSNKLDVSVADTTVASVSVDISNKKFTVNSLKYGQTTMTVAPSGKTENAVTYAIYVPSNITSIDAVSSVSGKAGETAGYAFTSTTNSFGTKSASAKPEAIGQISGNTVTFTSSDSNVATINTNGYVTLKNRGNAVLTMSVYESSSAVTPLLTKEVTVTVTQPVTSINITSASGNTVEAESTLQLTAQVLPANANNQALTWSSSNTGVATVNQSGLVTGVKAGTAVITAAAKDGSNTSATFTVTVKAKVVKVTSVTLDSHTMNLQTEDVKQLTATVAPTNATNTKVSWSSNNETVATVDQNGYVTAHSAGNATITCVAQDGSNCSDSCAVSVTTRTAPVIKVSQLTLDKTTAGVVKGETLQLAVTVAPDNATNESVAWSSSSSAIATVSNSGLVTAVGVGTATITVTAQDGSGVSADCTITVIEPTVQVTKVTLNKTKASVFKGKTVQLKATITPSDATDKSVTWTTSNSKVATVSTSGKVTAKAVGTATITCTAKDGSEKKATCKITVTNPVTKVKLNQTQASLSPKETLVLKATVTPSNATNKAVTWKSSNTKVATVTSSGKVTAKKAGNVTITCTAKDGSGKKATCKITVYTNTEAFVARIYTKALSRTPEEAGLKYWAEEINSGRKTPVEVAESFFFAPEFTNKNLSDAEYVKVLYRTFMGREYDQGGLDYWLARLKKGESRKSVLESFAGCQEFKDIVKSFGL